MMNLSSLLNSNEDGSANPPPKPSPPQRHQQQQPPSTPIQTGPSQVFRDYSNSVHASPRNHSVPSHEYGPGQHMPPGAPYASPSGVPGAPGPYGSRPVPPPLQPLNSGDLRSPGSAAHSGPSPYRHTPSSSVSGGTSGGYPFPPTQPPSASSPVQHHQYPPSANTYPPQRDSYPQPSGPLGMTGPPGAPPYMQGQQQLPPQTPPIGPPGGAASAAFPHQRSQSTHSTPTPTSAHSQQPPSHPSQQQQPQQPYGMPYGQGSPVVAHRPGPPQQQPPFQQPPFDPSRHLSQPPTPLGPPLSTTQQRALSVAGPYPPQHLQPQQQQQLHSQPASPLQQRMSSMPLPLSSSSSHHPFQKTPQPIYASPPPAAHSSIPPSTNTRDSRPSFAHQGSGFGQPSSESSHRRSPSRSDRAYSVSVSPKTRVPSLPSSAGGYPPHAGGPDSDQSYPRPHQGQQSGQPIPLHPATAATMARPTSSSTSMEIDQSYNGPSAKRKMDERDLHPDELDRKDARRPAPFENANGMSHHPPFPRTPSKAAHASLPAQASVSEEALPAAAPKQKKRIRYKEIPVFARKFEGGDLHEPNFIIRKPGESHMNGSRREAAGGSSAHHSQHTSRHASPEAARQPSVAQAAAMPSAAGAAPLSEGASASVSASAAAAAAAAAASANESRIALLGAWEESVTGEKPYEDLTRKVADFLYLNVVSNPNMMEIQGLGVQFEIEAKLGTLISKDTNQRVSLPVASECLLQDTGRVSFRSSMTEVQHKDFNEFLNRLVVETDARNPANVGRRKPRVPVVYKHRREIDRFFELPMGLQDRLPACVRNLVPHRHTVKVRVTYDKKTNEVLAKIVKARISDLNIFFPDASLDCRLSVNLEMPWEGALDELEALAAASTRERPPDREKDRLSYSQSHYQIDLTQVTYKVQGPNKMEREEKEHELEIELGAAMVIEQGRRAAGGEPHAYQELVDGLVDNVRILARRSRPA